MILFVALWLSWSVEMLSDLAWCVGRFGDRRLEKGGRRCSNAWSRARAYVCADWGKRRSQAVRFGRFLANENVTVERLIDGWSEQTSVAARGRHVLAIQDTTEINFHTIPERRRGLGEIGKGNGHGVLLHAMLAVDAHDGTYLGLVAGQIW